MLPPSPGPRSEVTLQEFEGLASMQEHEALGCHSSHRAPLLPQARLRLQHAGVGQVEPEEETTSLLQHLHGLSLLCHRLIQI